MPKYQPLDTIQLNWLINNSFVWKKKKNLIEWFEFQFLVLMVWIKHKKYKGIILFFFLLFIEILIWFAWRHKAIQGWRS